jgi:hypothetical protein
MASSQSQPSKQKPIRPIEVHPIRFPPSLSHLLLQRLAPPKAESKQSAFDEGLDDNKFFGFDVVALRKSKMDAWIGYLAMDIIDPPDGAIWGKFNNRALDHNWIRSMTETFATRVDNCLDLCSMEVAVDPCWLIDSHSALKSVDGLTVDKVPVMKFTPQGEIAIKHNNLWMLGGNHRRLALIKYIKSLEEKVALSKEAIVTTKDDNTDKDDSDPDFNKKLNELQDSVKELEDKIASSRMWTVKLYDRGASFRHTHRRRRIIYTRTISRTYRAREREQRG